MQAEVASDFWSILTFFISYTVLYCGGSLRFIIVGFYHVCVCVVLECLARFFFFPSPPPPPFLLSVAIFLFC